MRLDLEVWGNGSTVTSLTPMIKGIKRSLERESHSTRLDSRKIFYRIERSE